jgi:hypothetical protein
MNIALDASTLSLDRDGLITVRDGKGSRVRVISGSLWITEHHSSRDTIVEAGESFTIRRPGLTLIMALQPATLQLAEAPATLSESMGEWIQRLLPRRALTATSGC